ncbi:MAG: DNA-processing protein DprA, partial [Planctomycetia bacterium]|nr:DNA-processing protein DprA [Planctomycetia bacterium]
SYGRRMTQRLVADLVAAGFCIISGLARGIDSVAHDTALKGGGRTIAVLGGGLLKIFPAENEPLACRIIKSGAVISEFHPLCDPVAGNFPRRNRIVSAMSLGVLVVEAPVRSGSLITARLAMEQNHEVFAVPGPVEHENSHGCHRLIRDGAVLVESAADIIDVLGPLVRPTAHPANPASVHIPSELVLNDLEKEILKYIGNSPRPVDEIISESGLLPHQVLSLITALEFRSIVERTEGNSVRRR